MFTSERWLDICFDFGALQDPALIRPGRVDMVQLIDYASESQIAKLFRGAARDDLVLFEFSAKLRY